MPRKKKEEDFLYFFYFVLYLPRFSVDDILNKCGGSNGGGVECAERSMASLESKEKSIAGEWRQIDYVLVLPFIRVANLSDIKLAHKMR